MGEIRAFSEEFLTDSANLALRLIRGRSSPGAGPDLIQGFRRIFLENPWTALELPSLVYLEGTKVVGFVGVVPRPMQYQGRPIRVAVTTQFCVDRELHRGNGAIELMRRCFQGPQDLTLTDGAGEGASLVFTGAGGRFARLYSFNWIRLLRPMGAARSVLDRVAGSWLKSAAGLVTSPADLLLSKLPVGPLRPPTSTHNARAATPQELFKCIQEVGWREVLRPAYSQPSFDWMLAEAAKATALGSLRLLTIHDPQGNYSGWAVYYAQAGGVGSVLQIGVRRRMQFPMVLSALFRDSWEMGCCVIKGQAMPQFLIPLTEQYCIFRQPNPSVLVHSRDSEIMNLLQSGDAAISRLDGECWLPLNSLN